MYIYVPRTPDSSSITIYIHHDVHMMNHCMHILHTPFLIQGDYANAPTETEAITTFLDHYKDAMENRKAGELSFR